MGEPRPTTTTSRTCGRAHIAVNAQHLFLVVPLALQNESGAVRERPYPKVVRRIGAFFGEPRREVVVLSVHIFGY